MLTESDVVGVVAGVCFQSFIFVLLSLGLPFPCFKTFPEQTTALLAERERERQTQV